MRNFQINKYAALSLIYGLGASITVRFVGILSISEIIAIFFSPFIFSQAVSRNRTLLKILVLVSIWALGCIISDSYNNTDNRLFLKGLFTIIIFGIDFIFAFWLLKKDLNNLLYFIWGFAISFYLGTILGYNVFYQEMLARQNLTEISELGHYHKLVTAAYIYFLWAFSTSFYKKNPILVGLIIIIMSFNALLNGSRSTFLIQFLGGMFLIYISNILIKRNLSAIKLYGYLRNKRIYIFAILIICFIASDSIYKYSVTNGYLGKEEFDKYIAQSNSKIGLLSGRGEFVSSFFAIKDAPIIGHGSYAKDKEGYAIKAAKITGSDIDRILLIPESKRYIPTHSHIFGAWVNNGILGIFIWLFFLIIIVKTLFKTSFSYPKYLGFTILASLTILWMILFSPFSERIYISFSISFFSLLINDLKLKETKVKYNGA